MIENLLIFCTGVVVGIVVTTIYMYMFAEPERVIPTEEDDTNRFDPSIQQAMSNSEKVSDVEPTNTDPRKEIDRVIQAMRNRDEDEPLSFDDEEIWDV